MTPDTLFSIANGIALLGWIALVVLYSKPQMPRIVIGSAVFLLCVAYLVLLVPGLGDMNPEAFNTLGGVMQLFTQSEAVLVGWIHYLAFDLMTGVTIAVSGRRNGYNRWILMPGFFFTFMLGPVGLLFYIVMLSVKKREWLPSMF
jgi:hypothetical protein